MSDEKWTEDEIDAFASEIETIPQFTLTLFDQVDENGPYVEYHTNLPMDATTDKRAMPSLVYGLAIMSLMSDGTIERRADELLKAQTISQKMAVDSIKMLLMENPSTLAA